MNDLRNILEDAVLKIFQDHLGWEELTKIEQEGWPAPLWQQIDEQGIPSMMGSESQGGIEATWRDAYPVLRACGRYSVPLPVVESIICSYLGRQAGIDLPQGVPGLIEEPITLLNDCAVLENVTVPWGRAANWLLGMANNELVLLSCDGLSINHIDNIGHDARDQINGKANVIAKQTLGGVSQIIHYLGALGRSAQIAGGAAGALDLAVQYTADREQFGRPLAKFQAVQHQLADLGGLVASVDAMTIAACESLDRRGFVSNERDSLFEIAAAKCRASEAVEKITRLSHQVHGAIGFTYEYGLHFITRRLWAWRTEFGSSAKWGGFLGDMAVQKGGDGIWPLITD